MAPSRAAPGIVSTQAQTMRRVIPQRTAERRREAPTPTMAPVMVCVVLTGMPKAAVPTRVSPPAVSAAKPPKGLGLERRRPLCFEKRHPPPMGPPGKAKGEQMDSREGNKEELGRPP